VKTIIYSSNQKSQSTKSVLAFDGTASSPAFAQKMSPRATEVGQELTNTCEQDRSLAIEVVEYDTAVVTTVGPSRAYARK